MKRHTALMLLALAVTGLVIEACGTYGPPQRRSEQQELQQEEEEEESQEATQP